MTTERLTTREGHCDGEMQRGSGGGEEAAQPQQPCAAVLVMHSSHFDLALALSAEMS